MQPPRLLSTSQTNRDSYWKFGFRDISQSILGRFWQFKDQNIGFFVENANVSRIHENITMLKIWKVCKYSLNSISKFKPTLLLGTHRYYLFRANMPKYRFYSAHFSTTFIWHSGVCIGELCRGTSLVQPGSYLPPQFWTLPHLEHLLSSICYIFMIYQYFPWLLLQNINEIYKTCSPF